MQEIASSLDIQMQITQKPEIQMPDTFEKTFFYPALKWQSNG
jgi:hypothetical protein